MHTLWFVLPTMQVTIEALPTLKLYLVTKSFLPSLCMQCTPAEYLIGPGGLIRQISILDIIALRCTCKHKGKD